MFSGLIPAFDAINNYSVGYQATDIVGLVIAAIAILIQGWIVKKQSIYGQFSKELYKPSKAIADQQLRAFRVQAKFNRKELLKDGLYFYSRHPNYAGELGLWLGL